MKNKRAWPGNEPNINDVTNEGKSGPTFQLFPSLVTSLHPVAILLLGVLF